MLKRNLFASRKGPVSKRTNLATCIKCSGAISFSLTSQLDLTGPGNARVSNAQAQYSFTLILRRLDKLLRNGQASNAQAQSPSFLLNKIRPGMPDLHASNAQAQSLFSTLNLEAALYSLVERTSRERLPYAFSSIIIFHAYSYSTTLKEPSRDVRETPHSTHTPEPLA